MVLLDQRLESFGDLDVEITYPQDEAEARRQDREDRTIIWPQVDAFLRPRMQQLVAETKAQRLKGRLDHISPRAWQRQQWPFRTKDVTIAAKTGYHRMCAIAERIGQADAFAAMREEAYAQIRENLARSAGERSRNQSST
jgi:hypothetical protein